MTSAEILETISSENGRTIEIHIDESPVNPRTDFDNATVVICFHKKYSLGDKHDYNSSDFNSWDELEARIIKDHKPTIILPLYLYDHSGITIATHPFSCPWDSGAIGFCYLTPQQIRECYMVKRITKKIREKAEKLIQCEVEVYDQYVSGQVYGYVAKDTNGQELDSCWGYYGIDSVRQEAQSIIEQWKNESKAA
jgi:hypothetical protein